MLTLFLPLNFPLSNNPKLNVVDVFAEGLNSQELLSNLQITVEDWNGNQGPDMSFDDLSKSDQEKILSLITKRRAG